MTLVYMGERINKLGAQHWQRFSRQDYFDKRGTFYSAVVSGPLLLIMLAVLVRPGRQVALLVRASQMADEHRRMG